MSKGTLFDKVWDAHTVDILSDGRTQLFVGRHLVHEVTSPQAFEELRERGLKVKHPELTFATLDHVIPTCDVSRPYKDAQAELMAKTLEDNVKQTGINYFGPGKGQGVCHVVFPEQGVIWPGQVVVCGDSHTCTHGAYGALAFGIGTTQVGHVLATQTIAMDKKPKVRLVKFEGTPLVENLVTAKDVALYKISQMGVNGGTGFAEEYAGVFIRNLSMDGRLTLCNMSVEGGVRSGYIEPDRTTFYDLEGKRFAPKKDWNKSQAFWGSLRSGMYGEYDDIKHIDIRNLKPMVTWGTNPEQAIEIDGKIPALSRYEGKVRNEVEESLRYMGLSADQQILGTPVDVVFIGSCTNGRIGDLDDVAQILAGRKVKVRTLIVPGSEAVAKEAAERGYDRLFTEAGAEWRAPGCSMCLAMNPDRLTGYQRSLSTSNRNFKGRQGSPTGRTHLASPFTAAATAIEGAIADPRKYLG